MRASGILVRVRGPGEGRRCGGEFLESDQEKCEKVTSTLQLVGSVLSSVGYMTAKHTATFPYTRRGILLYHSLTRVPLLRPLIVQGMYCWMFCLTRATTR